MEQVPSLPLILPLLSILSLPLPPLPFLPLPYLFFCPTLFHPLFPSLSGDLPPKSSYGVCGGAVSPSPPSHQAEPWRPRDFVHLDASSDGLSWVLLWFIVYNNVPAKFITISGGGSNFCWGWGSTPPPPRWLRAWVFDELMYRVWGLHVIFLVLTLHIHTR